jgi:EmrB/QacA subfamily drug resistance transporter
MIFGYLLALAASLPASAWLARRFGTRRVYVASLAGFGLASVACALAPSAGVLIAFRVVQGFAGAPLVPLAMSILFTSGHGRRAPAAMGLMLFLAPTLGPTVGGLIVETAGWRPIFLVNVPVVAAGLAGVLRLAADPRLDASSPGTPFDGTGMALLAVGTTLLTAGALVASRGHPAGWGVSVAGAGMLGWYWLRSRHVAHPILDLRLLADAAALAALACCTVASIVLWAVLFLVPVFVQWAQGQSPLVTGLVLLPQGVVMAAATGLGERLTRTGRVRRTVTIGMVVLTLTTAGLLVVTRTTSPWLIAAILGVRGMAMALTVQPLVTGLMAGAGDRRRTETSTLFAVSQRVGGSVGIAAVAAFYQARAASGSAFAETVALLVVLGLAGVGLSRLLPGRGAGAGAEAFGKGSGG